MIFSDITFIETLVTIFFGSTNSLLVTFSTNTHSEKSPLSALKFNGMPMPFRCARISKAIRTDASYILAGEKKETWKDDGDTGYIAYTIRFPIPRMPLARENVMRSLWNPLQSLTWRARIPNPRRYSIVAISRIASWILHCTATNYYQIPIDNWRSQKRRLTGLRDRWKTGLRKVRRAKGLHEGKELCAGMQATYLVSEKFKDRGDFLPSASLDDRKTTLTGCGEARRSNVYSPR